MTTKLMTIFTRTPLHVGCGASVGAVDAPITRERHTRFPVIPGSSIKGVLADLWLEEGVDVEKNAKGELIRKEGSDAYILFGSNSNESNKAKEENGTKETNEAKKTQAGSLLIGEGKLLAFPVRSAKRCFAWITCPLILKRFVNDTGVQLSILKIEQDAAIIASKELCIGNNVVLEEFPFDVVESNGLEEIKQEFSRLSNDKIWKDEVTTRLALVTDEMFKYFVENACEIANHNRIDDETGVVAQGALFSQENVPSETMFYSVLNSKKTDVFTMLNDKLVKENNVLQIGADITTGLGWCQVTMEEIQ